MKKPLLAAICAILCAATVLSLASCGIKKAQTETDTTAARIENGAGKGAGRNASTEAATSPETKEDTAEATDTETDAETDEEPEPVIAEPGPEPLAIDDSAIALQYTRLTPAVDRSMITSTAWNALETHGDFSGCEEALADLESVLQSFDGTITLIAYAVDGSRSLCYNTGAYYQPQCTYKAAFIYSICQYMDAVGFDDSTEFTFYNRNRKDGSGTVKGAAAGTKFTVRDLVNLTLSISDNSAFSILHENFGGGLRNAYMQMIGAPTLMTSLMYGGEIPPGDFIVLWNEIYSYLQSGTHYSQIMYSACTDTPYAYACPQNGLHYSHKSGDGFDFRECHDVELVWDAQPYILAIYTRANVPDGSDYTMSEAARIVHERIY